MKILFLGDTSVHSDSVSRSATLRNLGHEVMHLDPERPLTGGRWQNAFHYRTGYRWMRRKVEAALRAQISAKCFDVAWVEGGATLDVRTLTWLRTQARLIVNYNNDDPTGPRDWRRWGTLREAVSLYDMVITVRQVAVKELEALGARQVKRVFMTYDEIAMRPLALSEAEMERWREKVLFVGTWMPERGPFLAELIRRGVPLGIYGTRWEKAREWPILKPHLRAQAVYGANYVKVLQSADVCLGLLSKGNRDLHTVRSSAIPAVGSLLCAERTAEHAAMYRENHEAVFWTDAAECTERCDEMLANPERRRAIAAAGHRRVAALRLTHQSLLQSVLAELTGGSP